MKNLIQRLCQFIDIEYDTNLSDTDEIWKLPLEERIEKGETIANVYGEFKGANFGGEFHAFRVAFHFDRNLSKFREGSPVLVSGHGITFKGEIVADNRSTLEITMNQWDGYPKIPDHLRKSNGWEINKAKLDIRHILKRPIENLQFSNSARFNLISGILSGSVLPEVDGSRRNRAEQLAYEARLDSSQQRAFIEAYMSKNYYLIQGPPGTGKTWLLAHLAATFAREGKNVLVTAFTHTGINNALQKIKKVTGYPKTVKLSKKFQGQILDYEGTEVPNKERLEAHGYNSSTKGLIIGATAYAPNTRKLRGFPFDIVIFDEASQMNIPLAVAAMTAGSRYIFIGDHRQLPPIISPHQKDEALSTSIFEFLFQYAPGSMLETTYRMNKEINAFSSSRFYKDILTPDESATNRRLSFKTSPTKYVDILNPNQPDVFVDLFHSGMSTYCQSEANLVGQLVEEAIRCGISARQIAVISPYRAQVRLIKNEIEDNLKDPTITKRVFVDTVERIQGQERDLVIFSLTTSDIKLAVEKAEFFFSPNRLNVALTRARKKRIVVGSSVVFQATSANPEVQKWVRTFQAYYDSTTKIKVVSEQTRDLF